MEATQAQSLRRSNGRLQACEPCRLRKVACDHTQPVCNRCRKRQRRGQEDDCVYLTSNPKPSRARLATPSRSTRTPTPRQIPTVVAPGYLGFTSHSTVFEETRNSLSLLHGPELGPPQAVRGLEVPLMLNPPMREKCLWVLKNLPMHMDWDMPYSTLACNPGRWIHRAALSIFQALRDMLGQYLGNGDDKLEELAQILCENTAKPFRDEDDPQVWLAQFTGSNLRWESLGLVWTFWEMGTGPIGISDQHQNSAPGPITTACLGYCVELARLFSQGNDVLLWLAYRRSTMESLTAGDASLACWSAHGASISLLTFLGLHAEPGTPEYKPNLCLEHKRRLFAHCFNIDKVIVAFTGRPPLLSGRYCSTPLPLDLSDEDLMVDGETLKRAVASLDENGWNTSGKVHQATLLRARVMCSYIQDEILEIALSPRPKTSLDDLLQIKARQLATMSTFPKSIQYSPGDLDDPDIVVDVLYARLLTQLKHLQNMFFVERLMLRMGKVNEGDLLVTSFEMVSLTLIFWTHKDMLAGIRRDFEWLLMAYAAPGGGILCLELLRPTFHGTHPKSSKLSRSSIVQQLSLLIGFLDWVRPSAPNSDLCEDCKAIIQKVLDHNLNSTMDGGGVLETLDWNFPTQLDFNFDLLDTFDWLRAD